MCLLASLLNPSGQGKKALFPEKVRWKVKVFKKKVSGNYCFLGKSQGNVFQKVCINPVVATDENVKKVQILSENNATVSAQVSGLGLTASSFNSSITRNELKWYLHQICVGHQLTENYFQRRLDFAYGFICTF